MPYIPQDRRTDLLNGATPMAVGEVNFLVTVICNQFLGASPRYADLNAVVGVLECAKLEFARRKLFPYEEGAMARNGDV